MSNTNEEDHEYGERRDRCNSLENIQYEKPYSHERGFCISPANSHSVLKEGWRGKILMIACDWVVFPGEVLSLLEIEMAYNMDLIESEIVQSKEFHLGLLGYKTIKAPRDIEDSLDQRTLSGYGVVCKVLRARYEEEYFYPTLHVLHRCRVPDDALYELKEASAVRLEMITIEVLPEGGPVKSLRNFGLDALNSLRQSVTSASQSLMVRHLDAALTPWPHFVFGNNYKYIRCRSIIEDYFFRIGRRRRLPSDPVSLSYWAAYNLRINVMEAYEFFIVDDALVRLDMICRFIKNAIKSAVLYCKNASQYTVEIARLEHAVAVFDKSEDGTNILDAFPDVFTVSYVYNTVYDVRVPLPYGKSACASSKSSLSWKELRCTNCTRRIGWRCDRIRREIYMDTFYVLKKDAVMLRYTKI